MDLQSLAERFWNHETAAIAVAGSFARGDEGIFSDIDLARFLKTDTQGQDAGTHLIDDRFVVVSDVGPRKVEQCFTDPLDATEYVAGLRTARPLRDPDGYLEAIQKRAREFVWDEAIERKAHAWASAEMVGWIEEVQKGLEGLTRGDEGRMLNARHGLTWGLARVMRVQRGILISSDNGFFPEVIAEIGADSEWARLFRTAFGIGGVTELREQVKSGLRLYVLTARMISATLSREDRPLIDEAARRIVEFRDLGQW